MVVLPAKSVDRQKGLALVIVLWMLTLLIIMASSFSMTMRREASIQSDIKATTEAMAMAEAGVNIAIMQLMQSNEQLRWRSDNSLYEFMFEGVPIRVSITDESGKIDLNQSDPQALRALLISFGLAEDVANKLLDAIADWRDVDDLPGPNGAEKDQYLSAGLKYAPRNKPFESIEELQIVLGMTPDLYKQIEPLVTVFARGQALNPAKASRQLLMTMPNVTGQMVDSYLQQRADNAKNGLPETGPTWAAGSGGATQVYEIVAEAMPIEGVSGAVSAVIRQGQSRQGLPFVILKWRRGGISGSLFADGENGRLLVPF